MYPFDEKQMRVVAIVLLLLLLSLAGGLAAGPLIASVSPGASIPTASP
jgi:hypothetical protein